MKVSVAIANFNYGRYLADCLDSVLSQTRPADEIIIVDDGSTDESREVLAGYADRVQTVLTENRGQPLAMSTAIELCSGDTVALLDSDDLMLPNRLERIAEIYAEEPSAQWLFHSMAYVDRPTMRALSPSSAYKGFTTGLHDVTAALAKGRIPIALPATSALSWRTAFLKSLLPVPGTIRMIDNYLKIASLAYGPGYILDEPLSQQGLHDTNMYTRLSGRDRRLFKAETTVPVIRGFETMGETMHPLADRLAGDELLLSRFGYELPADARSEFREHWRGLSTRRRARVAHSLALAAGRAAYGAVKRRGAPERVP